MMKKLLIVALLALSCTSCATILCGTKHKVTFDGDVNAPATMIVDGRQYKDVKLPYRVDVKRGYDDSEVRVTVEGYEPVTIYLEKTFNPWSLLNLVEPVGWIIDVATGAITQPLMDHYWIDFTPKAQ